MRRLFVVAAWMLATLNLIAQSLSGSVYDANSNLPLPGATILLKGTSLGTISSTDGSFTLRPSGNPPFTLVVSMVGYESQEIEAQIGTSTKSTFKKAAKGSTRW